MMYLWSKWYFKAAVAMLAMMAIVACTSATPTPIPTPTPTPDMGRRSDEAVKEMLWLYYIMLPAELEAAVIGTIAPAGSGEMGAYYEDRALQANYASLYLAMQCNNGVEASVSGFRKFIEPLLWMLRQGGHGHDQNITAIAQDNIHQIISRTQARRQLGLSPMKEPCERAYIAPQSAAEAELATGLIRAFIQSESRMRGFAEPFVRAYLSNIERGSVATIAQWFSKSDAQEIGFLDWAWRKDCQDMQVTCWPTPTPSTTTTPSSGISEEEMRELRRRYGIPEPTPTPVGTR